MSESKKGKHKHILSPVNAQAHIKRDRSERPLRSISKPRLIVDLLLDQVPLSIIDVSIQSPQIILIAIITCRDCIQWQYEQIVKCIKKLEDIDRQKRQRRCRPVVSIKEAPKEWWKYAARCHIGKETFRVKMSWEDVIQRGRQNILYVEACAKLLGNVYSTLLIFNFDPRNCFFKTYFKIF